MLRASVCCPHAEGDSFHLVPASGDGIDAGERYVSSSIPGSVDWIIEPSPQTEMGAVRARWQAVVAG